MPDADREREDGFLSNLGAYTAENFRVSFDTFGFGSRIVSVAVAVLTFVFWALVPAFPPLVVPGVVLGAWFFVLVLFVSPYRMWIAQRRELRRLTGQSPIAISLDEVSSGVRSRATINPAGQGPPSKWVQFVVASTTNTTLIECEALLTRVEAEGGDGRFVLIENEPARCCWSQPPSPSEEVRTTIRPEVLQSANLFAVYAGSPILDPQWRPMQISLANRLQKPGIYRLHVTVTAKDVRPKSARFLFRWGGSFDDIGIEMQGEGET